MIDFNEFKKLALSFPQTIEAPHFVNIAFKVNKKIFATYNPEQNRATVKLNTIDQDVFTIISKGSIFPVPNKWGLQGWTNIDLNMVQNELFIDAITTSYCNVAPPSLALQIRPE
ncbi:MAG: MmcQ/YjbR family DNA-binding protein [bacterium]|nr:MmcQ/YjbR family DNA-binding protein [bacterium]